MVFSTSVNCLAHQSRHPTPLNQNEGGLLPDTYLASKGKKANNIFINRHTFSLPFFGKMESI